MCSRRLSDTMKDVLRCLCRLCARKDEFCVDLIDNDPQKSLILKKIRICLPVIIQQDDGMPKKICFNCINKLDIAYDLYYSSLTAQTTIKRLLDTEPNSEREVELFQVDDDEPSTQSLDEYLTRKRASSVTTERIKEKRRALTHEVHESEYTTMKSEPPDPEYEDTVTDGVSRGIQRNKKKVKGTTLPPSSGTSQNHKGRSKKSHTSGIRVRRRSELEHGEANGVTHSAPSNRTERNGAAQTVTTAVGVQVTCAGTSVPPNVVGSQAPTHQASANADMLQNTVKIGGTSTENQTVPQGFSRVVLVQEPPTYSLGTVYNANGWPIATNVPVMNNISVQQPTHFLPQRIIVPPQMVARTPQTVLTQVAPAVPMLGDPSQHAATTVPAGASVRQMVAQAPQTILTQVAPTAHVLGDQSQHVATASVPTSVSISDLNGNNRVRRITIAANSSVGIQTDQEQDSDVENGVPISPVSNMPSMESNIMSPNMPTRHVAAKSSASNINGIIVSRTNTLAQAGIGQVRYAFAHLPSNATQVSADSNALLVQGEPAEMSRSGNSFNLSTENTVNRADLFSGSDQSRTSERFRFTEVPVLSATQSQLPHTSRIHILPSSINDNTFPIQPSSSSNVNSTWQQIDGQHNVRPYRNVLPVAESTKMKTKANCSGKKVAEKIKCYSNKKLGKEQAVKKVTAEQTVPPPSQRTPPPRPTPPPLTPPTPEVPLREFSRAEEHVTFPRRETSESVTQTDEPCFRDCPCCDPSIERRPASDKALSENMTPVLTQKESNNIDCHQSQACCEHNLSCQVCRPESPEDVKPELYIPEFKPIVEELEDPAAPKVVKEKCPHCRLEFNPDVLNHHKILHFKEKFYSCLECNKNFVTELGLESHRCTHKSV